jgi:hypothetical protein
MDETIHPSLTMEIAMLRLEKSQRFSSASVVIHREDERTEREDDKGLFGRPRCFDRPG